MREVSAEAPEAPAAKEARASHKAPREHNAGWMLLYFVAAALVAALVWLLFGFGA